MSPLVRKEGDGLQQENLDGPMIFKAFPRGIYQKGPATGVCRDGILLPCHPVEVRMWRQSSWDPCSGASLCALGAYSTGVVLYR